MNLREPGTVSGDGAPRRVEVQAVGRRWRAAPAGPAGTEGPGHLVVIGRRGDARLDAFLDALRGLGAERRAPT